MLHHPLRVTSEQTSHQHGTVAAVNVALNAEQRRTVAIDHRLDLDDNLGMSIQMLGVQGEALFDVVLLITERIAGRADVDVLDSAVGKSLAQRGFREALPSGKGKGSHIHDTLDAFFLEQLDELRDRAALVAHGEGESFGGATLASTRGVGHDVGILHHPLGVVEGELRAGRAFTVRECLRGDRKWRYLPGGACRNRA